MNSRAVIVAGFAAIILAMLWTDAAARRGAGRAGLVPLGEALTAALRSTAGRAVVLGVWLWLGWHFLAR